jgi:ABC-type glycerol-3-phosphate transport system substrate-binding protein
MVLNSTNNTLAELMDAGYLWDVNELIAKYAPKFKTYLDKFVGPEILNGTFSHTDGKTYQLVSGGQTTQKIRDNLKNMNMLIPCYLPRPALRRDYYEEIGSPVIDGPEAFFAALKAMKAKHPDKIGVLGNASNLRNYLMYAFGTNHTWNAYVVRDRTIRHYSGTPEYLEAMKFENRLAREGLLPKEAGVWTTEIDQNWVAGNVICYLGGSACNYNEATGEGDPIGKTGTTMVVLPFWKTYQYALYIVPWITDLFPKASKVPDRVIKFIEYAASPEGQLDAYFGVEGKAWTGDLVNGPHYSFRPDVYVNEFFPRGVPISFPEYKAAIQADPANTQRAMLGQTYFYSIDGTHPDQFLQTPVSADARAAAYTKAAAPHFTASADLWVSIRGDSPAGIALQKVNTLHKEYSVKMVFAATEAECVAMYNEFRQKAKEAGLDIWEAEATRIYQDQLKRSGK